MKFIQSYSSSDNRGSFTKYVSDIRDLEFMLTEAFVTKSVKGVVRGMHLQCSPFSGWKVVTVLEGEVFDVLIDLRPSSPTFKQIETFFLSKAEGVSVLIPEGVAHGFQALCETTMLYLTSYPYSASHDTGVNISSLEVQWPIEISSTSARDSKLPLLEDWK